MEVVVKNCISIIFGLAVIGLFIFGCDSIVDQKTDADAGIAMSEMAGAFSMVQSSEITCIDPHDSEYNKESESKTVEWGNRRNPFKKTVEIEYYNTLNEFVLRVKSSRAITDVLADDESIKDFDGTVAAGTWQEFTLDLDENWQAGDSKSLSLRIAGSGPPAEFEVNYTLLGECETGFTCGDPVTFMYNGSVVTYGTVLRDYSSNTSPYDIGTRCWLDRNLGAAQVAGSSTDAQAYGDLFQWGRAADGHQLIDRVNGVPISGTISEQSETVKPGHPDFIRGFADWLVTRNDDLWQGVDGINNPCPIGYRLPTEAEWEAERLSWISNNAAGAFASPLKLPVAGRRLGSSGSLSDVGSYGRYWSVTADGSLARYRRFHSGGAVMVSHSRALGLSVRCLKN